jgi:hypothetical protein
MTSTTFVNRWTHSDIDLTAREMYDSEQPWPLIGFLDMWKAGRITAPTPAVIQIVCAYRNLVNRRGSRAVDAMHTDTNWIKTVERKPLAHNNGRRSPSPKPKA